ncbi:MAG: cytochrome c peroxidase [Rubricoccaceae bacterium]|nr:cytochrome c peroxidase [Rubricoccaceae bacterium]
MLRIASLVGLLLLVLLAAFTARPSTPEPVLPATPYRYAAPLPPHLDTPPSRIADNTPPDNPVTDAGATLGRVLFYDRQLSRNGTTACGSCHLQAHGFADTTALSTGFDGEQTDRNAMGLAFARFYQNGRFFWDERAETLEAQVLQPIADPVEMGLTVDEAVARVAARPFYGPLFADAFGTPEVTPERMAKALAQFVRSIVTPNSRYDQARAYQPGPTGRPLPGLTDEENRGLRLFFGEVRCSECHGGDLMITDRPFSNGLDRFPADRGAGAGQFKVGSLRNVALTAPYMHDGRFATLEEVVEHYDRGIQPHGALFPALRLGDGRPLRLNLSAKDRDALVAFLETLTDTTLATDPRWSDPFPSVPR